MAAFWNRVNSKIQRVLSTAALHNHVWFYENSLKTLHIILLTDEQTRQTNKQTEGQTEGLHRLLAGDDKS